MDIRGKSVDAIAPWLNAARDDKKLAIARV
jgi:hypothetical protein